MNLAPFWHRVTLGGIVGGFQGTFTLGYTWSPLGDVATVTYPQKAGVGAARTVTNTYSNGFLTKVAQGATNYASSISYHTNATVNRVTYGNNVWVDHAKDPNDMARPAGISLGNATSSWSTGTYGYDGTGNIITMTGASTDTFVYDKVSRVKEARQTVGGVLKTQAYAYDSFGNLSSITTNGTPRALAVDGQTNRISGSGYDAAGSMTSWGEGGTTDSYAYYPTNQMMQMVGDGRTTLHGYSADGERVGTWDSVTGGITYVLRGLDNKPLRQYREFNGGWTWQKDWVYRDGLVLATIETSGTKYLHLDHLGTPRRITNSSRAVIASHDYYPFGEEITASSQDSEALKFTGHERDLRDPTKTTDDLDYMHARHYNPWLGRFLSTDPIGGTPGAPQSWNRYSYVMNNPPNLVDPTGEAAKEYADALDRRADEAKEGYLDLAKDGASQNDGSLAGIAVDTALNTVADVGQALTAAGTGLGDSLRAGDALGEAVGGGAGVGETALAAGKDTLRIGMMATIGVGVARSTVGTAAIAAGERGAAAVTNGALQTQVGRRLIGKGGLLNSGQNLRIGFGRRGGQGVLRVGGRWVERLTGRKHWDLVNLGDL